MILYKDDYLTMILEEDDQYVHLVETFKDGTKLGDVALSAQQCFAVLKQLKQIVKKGYTLEA